MNQDPATVEISVDTATQITQLLASYGIYALVVLFMFYQQHRERQNLVQASPGEKQYYRMRSAVVLGVTILFSVLAAAAWFYGAFVYKPKIVIEGTLKNLQEQPIIPTHLGDSPMVLYRLDAFREDVQFYSSKQVSLNGANFDLDWVLISPRGLKTLELIFQQEYCALEVEAPEAQIATLDQGPLVPRPSRGAPIKTARIDFRVHEALLREQIHLVYQPHAKDGIKKIGKLFVVHDGRRTEIPWDEDSPALPGPQPPESRAALLGIGVAWAQTESAPVFGSRGEISPEVAKRLRLYLESEDLKQQLAAQDALVQGGPRSFPTVRKILNHKSADPHSRNRLVHNVASAMEKVGAAGIIIDPRLSLNLAQALYEIGDYELAVRFFEKIPVSEKLSMVALFQRSYSYLKIDRYEEAKKGFEQCLRMTSDPRKKSMVTINLGTTYGQTGQLERAKSLYKDALLLDPRNLTALSNLTSIEIKLGNLDEAQAVAEKAFRMAPQNPYILNNLAYAYALQGINLNKALSYADQALKADRDNPSFLDTKGWVLYKLGRHQQGLSILEKALAEDSTDKVIRGHVEEARKALGLAAGF